MARRPFRGLLWLGDLLKVFYGQKAFYRSSGARRPCTGLLAPDHPFIGISGPEDFAQVFHDQIILYGKW